MAPVVGMRSIRLLVVALIAALAILTAAPTPAVAAQRGDCDGWVCEWVTFSGGTVTQWKASVTPSGGYQCQTVRFYVNGAVINFQNVCGDGQLMAYANTPYYLSPGDRLCAAYVNFSGHACVTL